MGIFAKRLLQWKALKALVRWSRRRRQRRRPRRAFGR